MHGFRKTLASVIALSLLLISSVPIVSAATCDKSGMDLSGMNMPDMGMQPEAVTPQLIDWQNCYIECGCRVNDQLDGMPHQLAPHALSLAEFMIGQNEHNVGMTTVAALIPLHLLLSPPPPKIS